MEKPPKYDELKTKLSDRLWRLNNLYYIVNEQGQKIKFALNPVQTALYKHLWFLNLILKSRQHGITTFLCILFLDACLFNSNIRAGIIAHNREDAESFFKDKIKFAYDNLPPTLLDARPAQSDSARELSFSNNSTIRVGTSMRSATLQYLHISEFGKICRRFPDKAKEIVTGALNTVHAGQFIAIESTAEGNEGYFFDFCKAAQRAERLGHTLSQLDFRLYFYGWHEDQRNRIPVDDFILPRSLVKYFKDLQEIHGVNLDSEQMTWYAKKWATQGDDMHREHPSTPEEAFEASVEGAYFATQFERIYKENRILSFPVESGIPVDTWWDIGYNDTNSIWFTQTVGREIRIIDYFGHSGEGLPYYKTMLDDKGYRYGSHMAPHDINVHEWGGGKTRLETAQQLGIQFEVCQKLPKDDQINAARTILKYCTFNEKTTREGIRGLENYRKAWDEKKGVWKDKPLHNWASNPADAFMTMGVGHTFRSNVVLFRPKRRKYG